MSSNGQRLDANETAYFARELEAIDAESYDTEYPSQKLRQFFPKKAGIDPAAQSYTYRQADEAGMAELIANAADDLPMSDVNSKEFTSQIRPIGAAYRFSFMDVRRGASTGQPLDRERREAADEMIERKIDDLGAFGDSAVGIPGVLTNPNVPVLTLPTGGWLTATAQQIVDDVGFMVREIFNTTQGIWQPDTMILPTDLFARLATKAVGVDNQQTVASAITSFNPMIQRIEWWDKLGTAGAGGGRRVIVKNSSPRVAELLVPLERVAHSPQERNLDMIVPMEASCGGVVVRRPLAMAFADNA